MMHSEAAVETRSLTRRFERTVALDAVDISIPAGGVVGLVGPNGSGKSTLIRVLLGLIRPTEGTAEVLGQGLDEAAGYLPRVGALIENPAFVPGLSARANLRSLAQLRRLPSSRVDEVLEIVGLTGRENEPVKRFSLGMKQRLGIAAALLPDPSLLILDEPTNGLDPSGIVEIRGLIDRLAREGRTIIVSSHLMGEIEAICDHLVIIKFGEILYNGPVSELLAQAQTAIVAATDRAEEAEALAEALTEAGLEAHVVERGVHVVADGATGAIVNRAAMAAGFTLASLTTTSRSLEEIFLDITGRTDAEVAAARAVHDRKGQA